jgi:hypothetical protein
LWNFSTAKLRRSAAAELVDPGCGALEGRIVEEERRRVRDVVDRRVQIRGAGCTVQRVANRDLMADDEDGAEAPRATRARNACA